jgi:hypothetical protein
MRETRRKHASHRGSKTPLILIPVPFIAPAPSLTPRRLFDIHTWMETSRAVTEASAPKNRKNVPVSTRFRCCTVSMYAA